MAISAMDLHGQDARATVISVGLHIIMSGGRKGYTHPLGTVLSKSLFCNLILIIVAHLKPQRRVGFLVMLDQ